MSFLRRKGARKMEETLFEIYQHPQLQTPSLIVGWQTQDIGKIGSEVTDFLKEKLGCRELAEIKPVGFFPLDGATFRNDLVHTTESKFWACQSNNLLLFTSSVPEYEKFQFLNTVLDFAKCKCRVKELFTVSGTASLVPHTATRRILTASNQDGFENRPRGHGLEDLTWEGPPAISSYLLWVAQRQGIPGVSLWSEVPFYLGAEDDPEAIRLILSLMNRRFGLGLELEELDSRIRRQKEKLAQLRAASSDVNKYIGMLERGIALAEEEQVELAEEVNAVLAKND